MESSLKSNFFPGGRYGHHCSFKVSIVETWGFKMEAKTGEGAESSASLLSCFGKGGAKACISYNEKGLVRAHLVEDDLLDGRFSRTPAAHEQHARLGRLIS